MKRMAEMVREAKNTEGFEKEAVVSHFKSSQEVKQTINYYLI